MKLSHHILFLAWIWTFSFLIAALLPKPYGLFLSLIGGFLFGMNAHKVSAWLESKGL